MSLASKMITARSVVGRLGYATHLAWIQTMSHQQRHRLDTPFTGRVSGQPVLARIDFGRWIADCECGGAEYVDLDERVFYCFSCGNRAHGGNARPVTFPPEEDIVEIEKLLMDRPIEEGKGGNDIEKALLGQPLVGELSRSWDPDESIQDLIDQNKELPPKDVVQPPADRSDG